MSLDKEGDRERTVINQLHYPATTSILILMKYYILLNLKTNYVIGANSFLNILLPSKLLYRIFTLFFTQLSYMA